ncbi:MAG: ATP-dependent Clp protease adaptor ClpS [Moraxella sp.]|uniref:ATP-dependent Clp protease adaptor ClpS n=1 Tax=Moraxella sp. TaxID=479 RepID=UPI0026DB7F42|nr:ATP-dependent Clp protease adaptor ClpS [Moraxella sp.]MDO4449911.1 ATP-dependent Clp protease adaptor ClpS [Moraxella sp.]
MSTHQDFEVEADVAVHHQYDEVPMFHVIMHNDNFTTMEFVVFILVEVFSYSLDKATDVMMQVHQQGSAVVATLPKEIGETKIAIVGQYAEEAEYPLLLTLERA